MAEIIHKKMSLFDAPKDSVLAHGCNARGAWGRGIAVEFKKRFPKSYIEYNASCLLGNQLGNTVLTMDEKDYKIACLITSSDYGQKTDSKDQILVHTILALEDLCRQLQGKGIKTVYSNKFNSGLFFVPWEETERWLKVFVEKYDLTWVVCDPG